MPRPNTIADIAARLVEQENGCRIWTGTCIHGGYGQVRWQNKTVKVHRLLYEHQHGPIPEGMHLHHICRNPPCANTAHLELLTPAEHVNASVNPASINSAKADCKRGHPLAGDNLYINPSGERQCRECGRLRDRRFYYGDLEKTRERNRRKYRQAAAKRPSRIPKAICAHGHPRVLENLYPGGACRICVLQRSKERYEQRKGEG